jgi:hypothetical protein
VFLSCSLRDRRVSSLSVMLIQSVMSYSVASSTSGKVKALWGRALF